MPMFSLCAFSPDDCNVVYCSYQDELTRAFAVRCVSLLSDLSLKESLLQLVQVLKFEPYHNSYLARFLLHRALQSRLVIGHRLFWLMKSEMHLDGVCERFGVLLSVYLEHCGMHRHQLWKQLRVNNLFQEVSSVKCTTLLTPCVPVVLTAVAIAHRSQREHCRFRRLTETTTHGAHVVAPTINCAVVAVRC